MAGDFKSPSVPRRRPDARSSRPQPALRLVTAEAGPRIQAIDLARGLAIALMILSHGIKGLLTFDQIPAWGVVPIHLVTKFSSTLFILVFGVSLAIAYLPHIPAAGGEAADWKERRLKLLIRGAKVLFWYKVLTVVEMAQLYTRQEVLDAVLYRAFPVYVEILGFYGVALLWLPLALPLWKRLPRPAKLAMPLVAGVLAVLASRHFGFFGSETLRTLLVENEKHYTWGQLSRLPIVMIGLLIGEALRSVHDDRAARLKLAAWVAAFGACALTAFAVMSLTDATAFRETLVALARNEGKHPPDTSFVLFSGGGALVLLAAAIAGGNRMAAWLRPVAAIGKDALQAFICHIVILFVFYRYLFDYWRSIPYPFALQLTFIMMLATSLWVTLVTWVRKHS